MRFQMIGGIVVLLGFMTSVSQTAETGKDADAVKTALQKFNDYIGAWHGDEESKMGKADFAKVAINWGWKFNKDGSASIQIDFKDSKNFSKGEVKYLPSTKKYQIILTGPDKKENTYAGEINRRGQVVATRVDSGTMDKYSITMSTTNEGALINMEYTIQTGGKGIEKKISIVRGKKEGSSISGGKKNECIVSGGVGTMAVSFGGKTYYVCCGGCRDAFNENPKKFVDEFEKKKK